MVQYNESSVFHSHVTVRVRHALATCPCVDFFVNVIFENIILRKPIHSLLLFRASTEISFDNIAFNSRYFSVFLEFFLEISICEFLADLHTTCLKYDLNYLSYI